eukprot:TRINITY_DN2952_c0_g1_i2.p1 TRINITY_DN2952_c0_g1~~TRINITY_DN2952_c0_g1_i2.p1  ORF type:complete len:2699 (+),score=727.24 TRINITY_DN2952_c0_g1_i2:219-8315(+)
MAGVDRAARQNERTHSNNSTTSSLLPSRSSLPLLPLFLLFIALLLPSGAHAAWKIVEPSFAADTLALEGYDGTLEFIVVTDLTGAVAIADPEIDWNDGGPPVVYDATTACTKLPVVGGTNFTCIVTHTFLDESSAILISTENSPSGTSSDTRLMTATPYFMYNADPTIGSFTPSSPFVIQASNGYLNITERDDITGLLSFSDATGDSFTIVVDWGDGSANQILTEAADSTGTMIGPHRFAPGFHTMTFTVVDDDTGSSQSSIPVNVMSIGPLVLARRVNSPTEASPTLEYQVDITDDYVALASGIDVVIAFETTSGLVDNYTTYVNGNTTLFFTFANAPSQYGFRVTATPRNDPTEENQYQVTGGVTISNIPADITKLNSTFTSYQGDVVRVVYDVFDYGLSTHTFVVDWGDGIAETIESNITRTGTFRVEFEHTYVKEGTTAITMEVFDSSAELGPNGLTLLIGTVLDVAPTFISLNCTDGIEGTVVARCEGDFTDPGIYDSWEAHLYYDSASVVVDDTITLSSVGEFTFTHMFNLAGVYEIRGKIVDPGTGSESSLLYFNVSVSNIPPELNSVSFSPASFNEGSTTYLVGTFFDFGSDFTLLYLTFDVDWGDGTSTSHQVRGNQTEFSIPYAYADGNAFYTATLVITDNGGLTDSGTASAQVLNQRPTIPTLTVADVGEGETTALVGNVDDPGVVDALTLAVNWGDGDSFSGVTLASWTLNYGHTYPSDDGVYTVTVTVADEVETTTSTVTTKVLNVAPTLSNGTINNVIQGDVTHATGVIMDPGPFDTLTLFINWGDGESDSYALPALGSDPFVSFDEEHTYADVAGTYTAVVFVVDKDGGVSNSLSLPTTVFSSLPRLTLDDLQNTVEGAVSILTGSIVDQSAALGTGYYNITITWGDGDISTLDINNKHRTFSANHNFPADDGTYTVSVTIVDEDGDSTSSAIEVEINNVSPTMINIVSNLFLVEGTLLVDPACAISLDIVDPSSLDTITLDVNWNDGSTNAIESFNLGANPGDACLNHLFPDDGGYTVSLTVTDDDGGSSSASVPLSVANAAPVLTVSPLVVDTVCAAVSGLPACNGFEGDSISVAGTMHDDGPVDWLTLTVSWGDFTSVESYQYVAGTTAFLVSHQFTDNGVYTVSLKLSDKDGESDSGTTTITVANSVPILNSLTADPSSSVDEGSSVSIVGELTEAGVTDVITVTADWGDGGATEDTKIGAGVTQFTITHTYLADVGTYTAEVFLTDGDGSVSSSETEAINIINVAPVFGTIKTALNAATNGLTLSVKFSDPGVFDTFTAVIVWESLTSTEGNETLSLPVQGRVFAASHTYPDDDGLYNVSIALTDDDGGVAYTTRLIRFDNVAPILENLFIPTVDEGELSTLTGTIVDPGTLDSFVLQVDWDDGSAVDSFNYAAGTTSFSLPHVFPAANAIYVVTLKITDSDGASTTSTVDATIDNAVPTVTGIALSSATVLEGSSFDVTGTLFDAGTGDALLLKVDWNDGSTDRFPYEANSSSFSVSHTYLNNGKYDAVFQLTDVDLGTTGKTTRSVTVVNVAPRLDTIALVPSVITEGHSFQLKASLIEPGSQDSTTLTITWGDSSKRRQQRGVQASSSSDVYSYEAGTTGVVLSHTYAQDGNYTVEWTLTDSDGDSTTGEHTITVVNARPTISMPYVTSPGEGSVTTITGLIADSGVEDDIILTTRWDAQESSTLLLQGSANGGSSRSFTVTHTFDADGPRSYLVSLAAEDDAGARDVYNLTVDVPNLPPVLVSYELATVFDSEVTWLNAVVSDPGVDDLVTATVAWGDGSSESTVAFTTPGPQNLSLSHTYHRTAATGKFPVTLTLEDSDGGVEVVSLQALVVNQPPTLSKVKVSDTCRYGTSYLRGRIGDTSDANEYTLNVIWGDGNIQNFAYPGSTTTFLETHTYGDDGIFDVVVSVSDDGTGGSTGDSYARNVTVCPVQQTLTNVSVTFDLFDGLVRVYMKVNDDGDGEDVHLEIMWGESSVYGSNREQVVVPGDGSVLTVEHLYIITPAVYTVEVWYADDRLNELSFRVSTLTSPMSLGGVVNLDESGDSDDPYAVTDTVMSEGEVATVLMNLVPGLMDDDVATITVTLDWGDETVLDTYSYEASTNSSQMATSYAYDHLLVDSGVFNFSMVLTQYDSANEVVGMDMDVEEITVLNVAPVLYNVSATAEDVGNVTVITGRIADPGLRDWFTIRITYGDGFGDNRTLPAGTTSFQFEHLYLGFPQLDVEDTATYRINIGIKDKDGATDSITTTAVLKNTASEITEFSVGDCYEGDRENPCKFEATIEETSEWDYAIVSVTWGDGSDDTDVIVDPGQSIVVAYHTYYQQGAYNVSFILRDSHGGVTRGGDGRTAVGKDAIVYDVPPEVGLLSFNRDLFQHEPATLRGAVQEPGPDDEVEVFIDWGDGSDVEVVALPAGATEFSADHTYIKVGEITVQVWATDDWLEKTGDVEEHVVVVSSSAPDITSFEFPESAMEGYEIECVVEFIEGYEDVDVTAIWGDGEMDSVVSKSDGGGSVMSPRRVTLTHTYRNDNHDRKTGKVNSEDYAFTLQVIDETGGTSVRERQITIANVAPALEVTASMVEIDRIKLVANYSDPGMDDQLTLTLDWGDGSSLESMVLDESSGEIDLGTHVYKVARRENNKDEAPNENFEGKKTIKHTFVVTLEDADGGVTRSRGKILIRE